MLFISTSFSVAQELVNGPVQVAGAMRDVMQNGRLEGQVLLDTLNPKKGLYGLGPESFLTGEILIVNGESFISRISPSMKLEVTKSFQSSAPFFVYAYAGKWTTLPVESEIRDIKSLETVINRFAENYDEPFLFMLEGRVKMSQIHVQNLPEGAAVKSPADAHKGQMNFVLEQMDVIMVGFYSRKHQGIFTHHDSFIHIHLLSKDGQYMGHLDEVSFDTNEVTVSVALQENE